MPRECTVSETCLPVYLHITGEKRALKLSENERKKLTKLTSKYNKTGDKQLLYTIFDDYDKNTKDSIKQIYEDNVAFMEQYKYAYFEPLPHFDELTAIVIYEDNELIIYYENHMFMVVNLFPSGAHFGDAVGLVCNRLNHHALLNSAGSITHAMSYGFYNPFYLYFSPGSFELFLQLEIEKLRTHPRFVYLSGLHNLETFFKKRQVMFPDRILGVKNGSDEAIVLHRVMYEYHVEEKKRKNTLSSWYKEHAKDIINNINSGNPKIMVAYEEAGVAVRYRMRAIYDTLLEMGFNAIKFISNEPILKKRYDILRTIDEFKPDIIITGNTLRFLADFSEIPDEIVFITLLSDPYEYFERESSAFLAKERDFILSFFTQYPRFENADYDMKKILQVPLFISKKLIGITDISENEYKKYATDIALVSARPTHEEFLLTIINDAVPATVFDDESRKSIREFCFEYYENIKQKGRMLNLAEWRESLNDFMMRKETSDSDSHIVSLLDKNNIYIQSHFYTTAGLDILIDKGFKNIKLYGKRFLKEDKYKPYAMGHVDKELELPKALQCAKIQFGNNPYGSFVDRTNETMASGVLYFANEICYSTTDPGIEIDKIITDKDCYVSFKDFDDLADKISYYLAHEDERKDIAEKGRQYVLNNHTVENFINRMLNFVSSHLN